MNIINITSNFYDIQLDLKGSNFTCTLYRKQLPIEIQKMFGQHETTGTTDSKEYQNTVMVFLKQHLCRLDPWPEALELTVAGAGLEVYNTMWGPSEFFATGNLVNFDRTSRLHEITLPTLFTCGLLDEATPETTASYQSLIQGAELAIFEQSSHIPHLEETKNYLSIVRQFLNQVEYL